MTFGLPRFRKTIVEWHASLWPLESGLWSPVHEFLRVFHVLEWRHELELCTLTLRGAPSSWGYEVPLSGVAC